MSEAEIVVAYVGAAATQVGRHRPHHSRDRHPVRAASTSCTRSGWSLFSILTSVAFSLFGFIIGIWAKNFEQLAIIPSLVVTPLTFLGGAFYSIDMLPPVWRTVSLFNPVVYLVSGFRWSFYGVRRRQRRQAASASPRCSSPSACLFYCGSSGLAIDSSLEKLDGSAELDSLDRSKSPSRSAANRRFGGEVGMAGKRTGRGDDARARDIEGHRQVGGRFARDGLAGAAQQSHGGSRHA